MEKDTRKYLGIDIGSTTFKAVVMDEAGNVLHTTYQRTKPVDSGPVGCSGRCTSCGRCNMGAVRKTVMTFLSDAGLKPEDISCTVVTGSQIVEDTKRVINYDFQVSEVSAHVAGAKHYYPDVNAIIDCGGQDSKCMIYNEKMGMWLSMMSGVCAAGTGSYLDSVAAKLGVPVEEISNKVNYNADIEFSSVCAVLSATSINKFKNRIPLGDLLAGACRAQARTILNGVGQLLLHQSGKKILFQGGVAANSAVAHYLREITGSEIVIPEYHKVMGALGAACLARQFTHLKGKLEIKPVEYEPTKQKSAAMRVNSTRREFFSKDRSKPTIWRNLFYPTEILNALGARIFTLETYAALFGRSTKRIKAALDIAARKGFDQQTCSFLRILEGSDHEKPAFAVSTSQPCQQGERIFADLAEQYGFEENFYSLQTPINADSSHAVEQIADGLEESISKMEKALGKKMDKGRLEEACEYSNQAAEYSRKCNKLRWLSPPLIRGAQAVYNSIVFSQLWGKKELVDIQKTYYEELLMKKEWAEKRYNIDDTHRLLWLHLPPFYDSHYLEFLETTMNAPIVFEETNFVGWPNLNPLDPLRSLAKKLLFSGFLDPKLRIEYISKVAKIAKLTGCVLYTHGFGRCSLADRPFTKRLREALEKMGLPLLILEGDCMDASIDPCSTVTKITSFVESLNLKKYGNLFGRLKEELFPPAKPLPA
ncbi:MAG: 2-hydroxyacyl-CoA dehydratase [Victivallales bacterium]|nr:2-hydroxyacyl-CoA dehydratase [Victivallales bacterium]MBR5838360.1 2-hydroxyacyl-CoA dehydratase [Victivallales bacterium]